MDAETRDMMLDRLGQIFKTEHDLMVARMQLRSCEASVIVCLYYVVKGIFSFI